MYQPGVRPPRLSDAWGEAKQIVWSHRRRLGLGMLLMLVNRASGLVLPATSKFLIDEVIGKRRGELLPALALAAGGATVVQAATSFGLSQVLGVAAQRAMTEMRKQVQTHVTRLPVRYFDSTQTGILISRIMSDADGIRNLVGTGLVQLVGSAVTAVAALGVLMILMGGRSMLGGRMTLGGFVMYLTFTGLLAAPLVQLASIGTQVSEAFAGLDRIREIQRVTPEASDDRTREPLEGLRGDVAFEDVSFEYNAGVPVLKHVSFRAPAGSTTALVGSSGSGKSTLIGLVMAFHRPLSGRILVDGRDLARVRLQDYRSHLGVVLQDNFLFDGTIAENIGFSRPGATRRELEEAGRIAHCEEFVNGFEKGYDTVVGERGVKLSGGQRQRVSIARAILADPTLLILDEATSSLDSESEAMIQDGLASLRRGRTTFVIAHRLSTIQSADQILVLEGGEIVERGTHQELLGLGGRYRQLYDKQYRLERDRFINPGEDFTPEPARRQSGPVSERGESLRIP